MATLIKIRTSDDKSLLVEVPDNGAVTRGSRNQIIEKLDQTFDEVVQHEIVENSRVLVEAFEKLKMQKIKPGKASAEFGLQFNAEGNIYVTKVSAEACYRISIEWDLA